MMQKMKDAIEPYLRGLVFMLIAVIFALIYDDMTARAPGDNMMSRHRLFIHLVRLIDKMGGKYVFLGVFVVVGILMIVHDVRQDHRKRNGDRV